MSPDLRNEIITKIQTLESPTRIAITSRYPFLSTPVAEFRRNLTNSKNFLDFTIARKQNQEFFSCVAVRHQSLLMRRLGDSNPRLQRQKITNLKIAASFLNGLVIKPGQTFSFWDTIGKPSSNRGFVNGMLLSGGKVVEGVGGGLCQMANLLYWMFLHLPVEITERHHHSMDVFPDSGRVLPFGSGATIFYNYLDLKIKNTSAYPLQFKIWLTDKHLKGQVLTPRHLKTKYHILETNHYFVKHGKQYYRYNEIWRDQKFNGQMQKTEKLMSNFSPVIYQIDEEELKQRYNLILI